MLTFFNRSPFLRVVAQEWLEQSTANHCQQVKIATEKMITQWLINPLGHKRIATIKPQDIVALLKVHEQHAPSRTRLFLQRINHIFNYAKAMGWCKYNPAEGLQIILKPHTCKGFAFIQPSKMPDFISAILTHTDPNRAEYVALWLLIYTATRRAEAIQAKIDEFDFNRALWTIPADRIKTRKPHIVPLAPSTIVLLDTWLQQRCTHGITGNLLFGNLPLHRPIELIRQSGYDGKMTIHGLRKIFSTHAHESGLWSADAIELQLAHTIQGVRGVYNKAQYIDERRDLMDWYASEVDKWQSV